MDGENGSLFDENIHYEQDQHLEIIVMRAKDELTIITTGDDVVESAFDLEPGLTHRGSILSPADVNCNLHA